MNELSIDPEVQEQSTALVSAANKLSVSDQVTYDQAEVLLVQVKTIAKQITSQKEAITKPLNAGLTAARNFFKPFESSTTEAEGVIKRKMLDYHAVKAAQARKEEERLQARVEKGTMKIDTAIAKAEKIERVENNSTTQFRTVRQVRIVDATAIPAKYFGDPRVMAALLTAVRSDALMLGAMPGVEIYEEQQLSARAA